MYQSRMEKLRKAMRQTDCEALFISHRANAQYLSGYPNDGAFLLVCPQEAYIITDFRYIEQARHIGAGFAAKMYDKSALPLFTLVGQLAAQSGAASIGFEADHLTYDEYRCLAKAAPGLELCPQSSLVEQLRLIKDEAEIKLMRQACQATDQVFSTLLRFIRAGLTEKQLEWEIMHQMQLTGYGNYAEFATLAGTNGSLPHGKASYDKVINDGEFVTMDFGCICQGYHADMTRTVMVGHAEQKQQEVYDIVLQAQIKGLQIVKSGIRAADVDKVVRDHIEAAGYGPNFGHGTGHGLGLEIHEVPYLRPGSADVLATGQIITVEPGIYLPGWGGIRIEDTLLVTETGCEILFSSSKELICL